MRFETLLSCLIVCSLTAPVLAQVKSEPAQPEWSQQVFTLDFTGGPLREFASKLQQLVPDLNLIVDEQAQSIMLQSFTLRNVNAQTAIATVDELLEPIIDVTPVPGLKPEAPVMLIRLKSGRLQTSAFATANIKDQEEGPKLVEVIDFAVAALPNSELRSKPQLKLHQPSGILLVTGDQEQLQIISEVVQLLGGESRHKVGMTTRDPFQRQPASIQSQSGMPGDLYGVGVTSPGPARLPAAPPTPATPSKQTR